MTGSTTLLDALRGLEAEALAAAANAEDSEALEAVRVEFLGRKDGRISGILRRLGDLSAEEKPPVGAEANRVKTAVQESIDARTAALEAQAEAPGSPLDLSLPARVSWKGGRAGHPVPERLLPAPCPHVSGSDPDLGALCAAGARFGSRDGVSAGHS
jgi:phenylalanyl-tRNA synthetase alpha chain